MTDFNEHERALLQEYEQIRIKNLESRARMILEAIGIYPDMTTVSYMASALHTFQCDELKQDEHMRNERVTDLLGEIGITVSQSSFPDSDPSYPVQYVLSYQDIRAVGPTIDIAQSDLIENLIEKLDERDK